MVSSVQHGDCQALVEAVIDAAGDTQRIPVDDIERCFGSVDELAVAAYCHAARVLHGGDDERARRAGPWLDRWERAVRAVVAAACAGARAWRTSR